MIYDADSAVYWRVSVANDHPYFLDVKEGERLIGALEAQRAVDNPDEPVFFGGVDHAGSRVSINTRFISSVFYSTPESRERDRMLTEVLDEFDRRAKSKPWE